MMHPSILSTPFAMAAFALLKRAKGPLKTLEFSQKCADTLMLFCIFAESLEPEKLKWELRFVEKCRMLPGVACFEIACAFQLWLAIHGQPSKIHIGKRTENGQILMHAWVESENASYFKASGFAEAFVQPAIDR